MKYIAGLLATNALLSSPYILPRYARLLRRAWRQIPRTLYFIPPPNETLKKINRPVNQKNQTAGQTAHQGTINPDHLKIMADFILNEAN